MRCASGSVPAPIRCLAPSVTARVHQHTHEPRLRIRIVWNAGATRGLQEGLLYQVEGVVFGRRHPPCEPVQAVMMGVEQGAEAGGPVDRHAVWKALGSRLHVHTPSQTIDVQVPLVEPRVARARAGLQPRSVRSGGRHSCAADETAVRRAPMPYLVGDTALTKASRSSFNRCLWVSVIPCGAPA